VIADRKNLRHVFAVTSGATPESGNPDYWDGDILWATPEDISSLDGYWLQDTRRKITQVGYESCGTTTAAPGSIVLTKRAPIGQLAVLAEAACSNQGCFLLTPRGEADTRFFYYWLYAKVDHLQALGRGSTFLELSTDDLKSLSVPFPSVSQQRAIADYLDRETARLDGLVAAKERVLGLLAERRRALITRAVTRGLDARAPLRDSGIPWLGDIPVHWRVVALKHLVRVPLTDGPHETPEFLDSGIPFVSAEAVWGGRVHLEAIRGFISRDAHDQYSKKYRPEQNDIYIVKSGATTGKVAIVDIEDEFNIWSPLAAIRCDYKRALPRFVFHTLGSDYFQGQVQISWSLGTQPNIGMEVLENLSVVLPPVSEQGTIVAHMEREVDKLDALSAATERTIALLKERRAAVIAAAVTGQLQIPEAA